MKPLVKSPALLINSLLLVFISHFLGLLSGKAKNIRLINNFLNISVYLTLKVNDAPGDSGPAAPN